MTESPLITGRTQARERALQLLYEAEQRDESTELILGQQLTRIETYARDVVSGVESDLADIDDLIADHLNDWPIERMAAIDRTIARIAVYELRSRPDVPLAGVLNEAVELAKAYSTEDSGRFLNGVLAAIAAEVRDANGQPKVAPVETT